MLALVAVLVMAAPVTAQKDLQTVYELSRDYTVLVPSGWDAEENDDGGTLFASGEQSILLFDPSLMDDLLRGNTSVASERALISAYEAYYGDRLTRSEVDAGELAGYPASLWEFSEGRDREGIFIVAAIGNGIFVGFDIVTPEGEVDEALEVAENLLASMRGPGFGESAVAGGGALEPVSVSAEPCEVSTGSADTVRLRVGPGENRTSVAFLPEGRDFEVTGRAIADDGSEWFRLNKEEAAPQTAANEIWVARDEIIEQGDCDAVVDVNAPPVVPIINAPAAPPTSAPGQPPPAALPVTSGLLPQGGTWTMTFARQSNVSCAGTGNVVFNTGDLWQNWSESDYVVRASLFVINSSSFNFGGDVYTNIGGNQYRSNFGAAGGPNTQLYLTVTSATTMVGQMTGNSGDCSGSTPVSVVRG
jgi:hypothetical protein